MKSWIGFFALAAILLTGCQTASKSASDVAIETHGFYGPWGDKHMPLIVVDPGHGGFDLGACHHACEEKDLALTTALMLKRYLNDMGYRVKLTRNRDLFIPLQDRARIANNTKSKLFVSIHYNAAHTPQAEGIEVYYFGKGDPLRISSSKKLATDVLSQLLHQTKAPSRGVKHGNFHVIRETKMPAILVEGGFITSPSERNRLKDSEYQATIARSIADGIDHYFRS